MRNFLFRTLTTISISLGVIGLACAANAQTIAVVDMQKIVEQSLAANDVRSQIKTMHDKFSSDIKAKEQSLQKEDQDLNKKHSVLSAEAYEKKRNEFKEKYTSAQRDVQNKRDAIDKSLAESLNVINNSIQSIVSDLSKTKNFDIAIYKLQVAFVKPEFDITSDVLSELNKRLPKVEVKTAVTVAK